MSWQPHSGTIPLVRAPLEAFIGRPALPGHSPASEALPGASRAPFLPSRCSHTLAAQPELLAAVRTSAISSLHSLVSAGAARAVATIAPVTDAVSQRCAARCHLFGVGQALSMLRNGLGYRRRLPRRCKPCKEGIQSPLSSLHALPSLPCRPLAPQQAPCSPPDGCAPCCLQHW